jgi:MFS transporter, FSR family, fosmidomycin resistance protein
MAQATAGVADAQGHDLKVTGLITCAHFFSHLYILALPPIFPVLRADLGLSVTELGLLLAALNVTTVLAQPPIGVLVDRYGPGLILIAGQIAFALGIGLAGLGTGLASFLPLMVLAGLGNAVYHPADYAILSARVSPGRTARAFSIHTFGGYAGFAAAPVVMVALTALVGWRMGLLLIGAAGLVMAAVLIAARGKIAASVSRKKEQGAGGTLALLTSPAVLGGFAFFLLLALGHAGISGFSVVALTGLYGLGLAVANAPVTVFLTCGAMGVLAGGWVADRFGHHGLIVAICSLVLSAMAGVVALVTLPPPVLLPLFAVGGLASGMVAPSRDMMIRAITPPGASGRVFGLVMVGFNVGGLVAPPLYGLTVDHASPAWVFGIVAMVSLATALTVFGSTATRPGVRPPADASRRSA